LIFWVWAAPLLLLPGWSLHPSSHGPLKPFRIVLMYPPFLRLSGNTI